MKKIIVFCLVSLLYVEVKGQDNYDYTNITLNNKNNNYDQVAHNDRFITFGINMNISEPLLEEFLSGRVSLGYEFKPKKNIPISLETQLSLFLDRYRDENWLFERNYFAYNIYTPSIMLIPKFVYEINDDFSFVLDNEISIGIPTGKVNYRGNSSSNITNRNIVFAYGCNIGLRIHTDGFNATFRIGYTTFNPYKTIERNKPKNYIQQIPHPHSDVNVSVALLLPFLN